MLYSVNQLKVNQTWKLSAKKIITLPFKQNYLLYEESPIWFHFYFNWIFPVNNLSGNEKKKNQLIDIRHTRQKRCWYILSWTVWTGAPYFWFCSFALKPWKLSWIFTHLVPSERSLQKKNNMCRSSNHFKGFSFNSYWNYNKICVWNLVFYSGLWPWTFSLLVFNFHQKQ